MSLTGLLSHYNHQLFTLTDFEVDSKWARCKIFSAQNEDWQKILGAPMAEWSAGEEVPALEAADDIDFIDDAH